MAGTLFAPIVRAVQPAITDSSLNIYFTIPYPNSSIDGLEYLIIDPTKSATDGNNILLNASQNFAVQNNLEQMATIALDSIMNQIEKNQYYQIQIRLKENSVVSAWSQISLFKYTDKFDINIVDEENLMPLDNLMIVGDSGANGPALKSCSLAVGNQTYSGSVLGSAFEIKLTEDILQKIGINEDQKGIVLVESVDGQIQTKKINIILKNLSASERLKLTFNTAAAAINVLQIPSDTEKILRKDSDNSKKLWTVVGTFESEAPVQWTDYTVEGGKKYSYCAVDKDNNAIAMETADFETDFYHLYLADNNLMISIHFNPATSGLKYVTQEAITNTLGGKYPVIRKNGETKYKQFNIAGLLYLDYYTNEDFICSISSDQLQTTEQVFRLGNESCLYMTENSTVSTYLAGLSQRAAEKELRKIAEDFLLNEKVKIFRSYEEGPMFVHLSNISFSPNKQLNDHIYEFSAQATEICEFNSDNLARYGFTSLNLSHFYVDKVLE